MNDASPPSETKVVDSTIDPSERWPLQWVGGASVALVALASWQQTLGWPWLVAAGAGVIYAVWQTSTLRSPRWWAMGATVLLIMALSLAVGDTVTLQRAARDWGLWSEAERVARANRVASSLSRVSAQLTTAASTVAADSALLAQLMASPNSAPGRIRAPLDAGVESALLVFRGRALIERAGQTRTAIVPTGGAGIRLVEDAFYSSLVARALSPDGSIEVVAVALVSAIPPADRFARALTQSLTTRDDVSRTIIESPDLTRVDSGSTVNVVSEGTRRLARVRTVARTAEETRLTLIQRALARTAVPLAFAALLVLVAAWRRPARTVHRLLVTAVLLLVIALAPLSALSNVSPLFDASSYFVGTGGPWTANVAALLLTTALALAMLFLTLRSGRVVRLASSRVWAGLLVLLSASLGPFLLRDLARGIVLPPSDVNLELWIAWQLAIALAGASVLHMGAAAGRMVLGTRRGLPPMTAPTLAVVAAVLAPVLWRSPGAWPAWYPVLWVLAIAALALTRRGVALVTGAAVIAGAGAVTLTWGATVRARMQQADYDVSRLSADDEGAERLIARLAMSIAVDPAGVTTREGLLRRYAASELAQAGYQARLASWDTTGSTAPVFELQLAQLVDSLGVQGEIARLARESQSMAISDFSDGPSKIVVAAIPSLSGQVTTIAVPPRSRLTPSYPFASLTGLAGARGNEPPYRLTLTGATAADTSARPLQWRRRGDAMHGDGVTTGEFGVRSVHVEIDLRGLDALLPRGALLVLLDVAVVLLIWGASAMADGAFVRWFDVRRARLWRSYRARLSAALLAFFVAPASIFALWSWYRLQDDDRAARELLVREALRTAASDVSRRDLASTATSVGSPLFLYRSAQLGSASDSLLTALSPLGRLLPVSLESRDFGDEEVFTTRRIPIGTSTALVGFRRVLGTGDDVVVVTPARGDEFALDARREDLGVLLLFSVALGALAAVWSSGIAARSLARPVGALREAALSLAAGGDVQALGSAPASEFAPVYRAFGRMASDLATSRAALEAAQRRTDAVLQHVASGVVAMRMDGDILIANPRAEQLLGVALREPGATITWLPETLRPVMDRCTAFLANDDEEDAFDHHVAGRQLRGRLTRLAAGAVLTLDDVTELASAQRVLAWGEMARQVAHEIKNPLTPIRLGVQHLRRAYRDGRGDFATILDTNVSRVLSEIDHLDQIARAFSRYGTAPDQREPAVAVDVIAAVRDVITLEQLGEGDIQWQLDLPTDERPMVALGQRDELKEVLLNLLENARLASARLVTVVVRGAPGGVLIDVRDDGQGIAPDVLPQVFEPHFSTRTSGSGLGLAISRRLIEGWGGQIRVESAPGKGTTVHVVLRSA